MNHRAPSASQGPSPQRGRLADTGASRQCMPATTTPRSQDPTISPRPGSPSLRTMLTRWQQRHQKTYTEPEPWTPRRPGTRKVPARVRHRPLLLLYPMEASAPPPHPHPKRGYWPRQTTAAAETGRITGSVERLSAVHRPPPAMEKGCLGFKDV